MVVLGIVGSREMLQGQYDAAANLVDVILVSSAIKYDGDITVISGGANGVDTLAEESALRLKLSFVKYEPTTNTWGGVGGYKERNTKIALDSNILYCIQNLRAETYGSGWTYEEALRRGKVVGINAFRYWV